MRKRREKRPNKKRCRHRLAAPGFCKWQHFINDYSKSRFGTSQLYRQISHGYKPKPLSVWMKLNSQISRYFAHRVWCCELYFRCFSSIRFQTWSFTFTCLSQVNFTQALKFINLWIPRSCLPCLFRDATYWLFCPKVPPFMHTNTTLKPRILDCYISFVLKRFRLFPPKVQARPQVSCIQRRRLFLITVLHDPLCFLS